MTTRYRWFGLAAIKQQLDRIEERLIAMSDTEQQARGDLDSIAASEKAIATGIAGLQQSAKDQAAQIAALQAQIAAGQPVTAQDLADLHANAVQLASDAAGLQPAPAPGP